jgi:hypothetical protein
MQNEQKRKILAEKIKPSIIVGEKISLKTRKIGDLKPPVKSSDCETSFYRARTDNNSEANIEKVYTGASCIDLIGQHIYVGNLPDSVNLDDLIRKDLDDKLSCNRADIMTTDRKVLRSLKVKNNSGRHKIQCFTLNSLTYMSIYEEDITLKNNQFIEALRELKSRFHPKDGAFIIPDDLKLLNDDTKE